MVFYYFFFFLLSLCLGSFTQVIIDRLPKKRSFLLGRSDCDFCHHTLAWYDLIPILSFLLIGGRCRYCHKELPKTYIGIELLFASFYTLGIYSLFPYPYQLPLESSMILPLVLYSLIFICLFAIFFIDLLHGIIPFAIVIPAGVCSLIFNFQVHPTMFPSLFFAASGAFLFFFLIILFTKGRGMGFGDSVFAFFMGLLLGFPTIITALYIAFLTGAFVSLILILWRKKKLKNGTIPFGPFLVLGTYASLLYGDPITRFFLTLILH